jgi:hypothetical protein
MSAVRRLAPETFLFEHGLLTFSKGSGPGFQPDKAQNITDDLVPACPFQSCLSSKLRNGRVRTVLSEKCSKKQGMCCNGIGWEIVFDMSSSNEFRPNQRSREQSEATADRAFGKTRFS